MSANPPHSCCWAAWRWQPWASPRSASPRRGRRDRRPARRIDAGMQRGDIDAARSRPAMIALSPLDTLGAQDFHATPSQRSLNALLGVNFLLAGILVGFGPFIAVYLAQHHWGQAQIGMVLTAGGLASLA